MSDFVIKKSSNKAGTGDRRLQIAALCIAGIAGIIMVRLFFLMVVNHSFYEQLAAGAHDLYAQLFPKRGSVFIQDTRTKETFPLAMNRDVFLLYADTRNITTDDEAEKIAETLAPLLGYDDEKKFALFTAINKRTDPYEPIEPQIEESVKQQIEEKQLPGIQFVRQSKRFYPEGPLAASVIGFLGKNEEGKDIGRYGIEGYWNDTLAGVQGYVAGLRGAGGSVITSAGRVFEPAQHGSDVLLTLDRTLQYRACEILRERMTEYGADSASLIMMNPHSGAIIAMCSLPDFDPNIYSQVDDAAVYNNASIFTPYEPGSIMKPLVMAAAINEELVTPNSVFFDSGFKEGLCQKPIRNANNKSYGDQTMTGVLENSINTGMIYIAELLGKQREIAYLERFGLGVKEGIELDKESSGTLESLSLNSGDKIDCYAATASFGQGITATPLQMVTAFSAIANGGLLMKPYIVEEIRHSDGRVEKIKPTQIRRVISERAAGLVGAMMVSVIEKGQTKSAVIPGYHVAGKTGTAQIAEKGIYVDATNHSFVGFVPVEDPAFVMIVTFEKPDRGFADSTSGPTFQKIASFALQYYGIAPRGQ